VVRVTTRWILVACLGGAPAAAILSAPAVLRAQPAEQVIEGHILAIEEGDIVVDVAGKRGASAGNLLELWRPLKLKHPVTGKVVTDRFRIGSLRLTQVRDSLAMARPEGTLSRPAEPGDVVVLRIASLQPAPAQPGAPQPAQPQPGATAALPAPAGEVVDLDPEARAVVEIFEGLKNADVTTRILRYEDYVRKQPQSRFAAVLYEEAQQLRRLLKLSAQGRREGQQEVEAIEFEPPGTTLAGVPLEVALEIGGPVAGAVFHARNAGEVAYQPMPMRAAGHGYWSVTIPAERMKAPELQYFIEATTASGKAIAIVSAAESPGKIRIERIPEPAPPARHEATLSVLTDYADYNQFKGNDWAWQTEAFAGMRFQDEGVRALRTGFGVYRGRGGSLEELDQQEKRGRPIGLTYGYLEGEYAFSPITALIVRGVVGLRDDGVGGGAQAHVRIGNDKKTNLTLGGEVLGGVGFRGIVQFELATFERVPVMFRTEVTNQPAGVTARSDEVERDEATGRAEVGARAIAQVGYELVDGLVIAARGSYQGRTIKHAGPGFGGAVTYTW
jgi:hypothetical protein